MKLTCGYEKCEHYAKATKYPRACYYEPNCWRGFLSEIAALFGVKEKKDDYEFKSKLIYECTERDSEVKP